MESLMEPHLNRCNIVELLNGDKPVKICAPMVRYSQLAFRTLVRKYGCDIAYTPMIISSSFVQSKSCRDIEFTTNKNDRPLVVQFAASSAKDFADATELVYPFCDGVGLNCGCPQRWAMAKGYGAKLLQNPERLVDYIRYVRAKISDEAFSVSAKIRLHEDLHKTVEMCQMLEKVGVSFISVHGRTTKERNQPVHYDAIKLLKESIAIPIVANGDIKTWNDVEKVHRLTEANGVMVAQGLLNNPSLFSGAENTTLDCVQDWIKISLSLGTNFTCFHNHLIYMLDKVTTRSEKRVFNALQSTPAVLEYLEKFK